MQNIFDEVSHLDQRCYEEFALTEDLLMEHASNSMAQFIESNCVSNSTILIVCGVGNNGADGLALARLLYKKYDVKIYLPFGTKSQMAKLQYKRVKLLEIEFVNEVVESHVLVDCLFGSGLNKELDDKSQYILHTLNNHSGVKIACDIPSGINALGQISSVAFIAQTTITMGALKTSLFTDSAKDYVGNIVVANLGVQREVYETSSNIFLLDYEDMKLPLRNKRNAHKGTYGHLNVIAGCKKGAGVIAAKAAFGFGAGLVSVVCHEQIDLPYHIMQTHKPTENCSAVALGMGLGRFEENEIKEIFSSNLPLIIDADLFYEEIILEALHKEVVLTPHPKEFCSLLKLCNIAHIDVDVLQKNRFFYVKKFCEHYRNVVLLLKGANVLIGKGDVLYVNTFGTSVLSKGGSGDVLSGLIGALLAQGYNLLDAAITGSLAHVKAANNYTKNNYSLIPSDLVEEVKKL